MGEVGGMDEFVRGAEDVVESSDDNSENVPLRSLAHSLSRRRGSLEVLSLRRRLRLHSCVVEHRAGTKKARLRFVSRQNEQFGESGRPHSRRRSHHPNRTPLRAHHPPDPSRDRTEATHFPTQFATPPSPLPPAHARHLRSPPTYLPTPRTLSRDRQLPSLGIGTQNYQKWSERLRRTGRGRTLHPTPG